MLQGDLLEVRPWSAAEEYARRYTGMVVSQLVAHASDKRLSDWDRQFLADMDAKIARYRGLFLSDRQAGSRRPPDRGQVVRQDSGGSSAARGLRLGAVWLKINPEEISCADSNIGGNKGGR